MKVIKVPRKVFLQDLENCLTILNRVKSNLFKCEYITPGLFKKIILVEII